MPDVKIKGYSGNELHYADVPRVWLAAEESTEDNPVLVPFTYGEAMDDVEIVPDFSEGDMRVTTPDGYLVRSGVVKKPGSLIPGNIKKGETVAGITGEYEGEKIELEAVTVDLDMSDGVQIIEPSEGKALSKVTVTKPETLVPENVAEGVDIAGIIGTLVAGGGAIVTHGNIMPTTTGVYIIEHNLGVIPDIFIIFNMSNFSATVKSLYGGIAFSDAFKNAIRSYYGVRGIGRNQSTYSALAWSSVTEGGAVSSPTPETITIGTDAWPMAINIDYSWVAIGGLT